MTNTFQDRVAGTTRLLEQAARDAGHFISGDGRVSENDAARLLCYSPDRLKHLRHEGGAPTAFKIGMNGCRISYRLHDLAAWVEEKRDEC